MSIIAISQISFLLGDTCGEESWNSFYTKIKNAIYCKKKCSYCCQPTNFTLSKIGLNNRNLLHKMFICFQPTTFLKIHLLQRLVYNLRDFIERYQKCRLQCQGFQVQCSLLRPYLVVAAHFSHKVFFIGRNNFMLTIRCFTYTIFYSSLLPNTHSLFLNFMISWNNETI